MHQTIPEQVSDWQSHKCQSSADWRDRFQSGSFKTQIQIVNHAACKWMALKFASLCHRHCQNVSCSMTAEVLHCSICLSNLVSASSNAHFAIWGLKRIFGLLGWPLASGRCPLLGRHPTTAATKSLHLLFLCPYTVWENILILSECHYTILTLSSGNCEQRQLLSLQFCHSTINLPAGPANETKQKLGWWCWCNKSIDHPPSEECQEFQKEWVAC